MLSHQPLGLAFPGGLTTQVDPIVTAMDESQAQIGSGKTYQRFDELRLPQIITAGEHEELAGCGEPHPIEVLKDPEVGGISMVANARITLRTLATDLRRSIGRGIVGDE